MRAVALTLLVFGAVGSLFAASIDVFTSGAGTANFGTVSQNAGPFPWSDLGITAGASVSGGSLSVQTGGNTSFSLPTVSGGQSFVSGSTVLNLGYSPNWTGQIVGAPAATGNLNSQFVYNIGPFNGSANLFNANLFIPGINSNISSNLNSLVVLPSNKSQTVSGPGLGATLTVQAQACFIICATVASASVGFDVGSQLSQDVSATPVVTNEDLVWYSTDQSYSTSDPQSLVAGSFGNVANTFAPPSSFLSGLSTGETFYMNILPAVQLTMPVIDAVDVALPASINASWNIFGFGGSESWALGNLYELSNGGDFVDFTGTWYGGQFDSVPLIYTAPFCAQVACFPAKFTTPESGPTYTLENGGIPADVLPPPTLTGSGGTPGLTGYGTSNIGPLFPQDPTSGPVCGVVGNNVECINRVEITPEPGGWVLMGAGLLSLVALRRRIRS